MRRRRGCSNHHFGGLSQRAWSPIPSTRCCSNHHFGGLSQRRWSHDKRELELLEPPFRWPFTTLLAQLTDEQKVARTTISVAFHNSAMKSSKSTMCCSNHHFGGLSQLESFFMETDFGCSNHHFGGLSQLRTERLEWVLGCSNHHFGGLSQLVAYAIVADRKLLEPPFRWPFTTHVRSQHVQEELLEPPFRWPFTTPDRRASSASVLLEPPFRWPFTTAALARAGRAQGCSNHHFGGLSQLRTKFAC